MVSFVAPAELEIDAAALARRRSDLIQCFAYIAKQLDRSSSLDVLLAGAPFRPNEVDTEALRNIADSVGLEITQSHRPIDELTEADLPAIGWMVEGFPVVLEKIQSGQGIVAVSPVGGERFMITDQANVDSRTFGILTVRRREEDPIATDAAAPNRNWFRNLLWNYVPTYKYVILASVLANILVLVSPLFVMNVYDRVLPNRAFYTLFVLAIAVVIASSFDLAFRLARSHLIDDVARRVDLRASSFLIEKVLNAKLSALNGNTGQLLHRLQRYEFVREFLTSNTIVVLVDIVFGVLFLIAVAIISPIMILVPIIAGLALAIIGLIGQRQISGLIEKSNVTEANKHTMLLEMVSSLTVIKALCAEGSFLRKWNERLRHSAALVDEIKVISSRTANWSTFVLSLVTLFTVVLGAVLFDYGLITTGGIIACVILSTRAVSPMGQLALMIARYKQAMHSLKSIEGIAELEDERNDKRHFTERSLEHFPIEFRDVSFQFPGKSVPVLRNVSFVIRPGERVAILGKVGAGKTTIGALLARLAEPVSGNILVGSIDYRQYHPHVLRKSVMFVGQEDDLFEGTLRSNLLIGKPEASDDELIEAAKLAGIDAIASAHPLGYEMPIGERGRGLSSGQKQMIGLARAFLNRSPVMFLDDPTSSMDVATERAFVQRLAASLGSDRTLILTTHRSAMLALVDRIIVVDQGRIVRDGAKGDVLKSLGAT